MKQLDILESHGIPTGSYIHAIQHINDMEPEPLHTEVYEDRVSELVGRDDIQLDAEYARHIYLYLVQGIVRSSQNTDNLDMDALFSAAVKQATVLVDENPEFFAEKDIPIKLDHAGKPKRKKGAKKIEAARIYQENKNKPKKEIMAMFIDDLGMTKAGASTYFYNNRKLYG